ncbi:PKD domain-containing protein, partial [Pseudolysinimonas sp.]|uniref:PKD domain-containing protein n=1 Tax=Pseudolysinimonas sp. TaxID=2680009 RepID=UPI00286AB014
CFEADEPAEPGIPTITIRDIASFIPTPGRQQMEPDGWTVAGLDTNFYAIAGQHVVNGTLLGRPADVRFTPTTYRWTYGDGTAATKTTKGGTWAALGIAEFEPTPTSHVYEQVGDYTITLSIVYAAEYRFDGGAWRPVVGTLTLPANDLYIRVGTAKTVLVEHDCLANPSGPGC